MLCVIGLLNISPVQTYIAQRAADYLSNRLQTKVTVASVSVYFFDRLTLNGVFIADQNNDTLLYTGKLGINTNSWFFMQANPVIEDILIEDASIHLLRNAGSAIWNYDFILSAFPQSKKDSTVKGNTLPDIHLKHLKIKNANFSYIDAWIGTDYYASLTDFEVSVDKIDWKAKAIDIKDIQGNNTTIGIKEYKGGRPAHLKKPRKPYAFSPFNPAHWQFTIGSLQLGNGRFFLEHPDKPVYANKFDERHLDIGDINLQLQNIKIVADTIYGKIKDLQARDRSGLAINAMRADVKVSPNIAECKNLFLKTDYSELHHYYAMHYDKFPDFLHYIEKVKMEGKLSGSIIGMNDILYFTDALDGLKDKTILFSGTGWGTVDHLKGENIALFDGVNKWKGDITLLGIPDMDNFFIESSAFEAQTSNIGLYQYFPDWKLLPHIKMDAIQHALIAGSFKGYLHDFKTNLNMQSNLGRLQVSGGVKNVLDPSFKYDLQVNSTAFDIGQLLAIDLLDEITMNAELKGVFKDGTSQGLDIVGKVQHIDFNNYAYTNIGVDGVFNQQSFEGTIVAKDPNFNGAFNGLLDFHQNIPHYKADAQIHNMDLHALGFTVNKIHGSAEFNIDFRGKTMDDFIGNALIYNLYLSEDSHKLDLNQVYLSAAYNSEQLKTIQIATNGLQAKMTGKFNLAGLPHSLNSFLKSYIPNYITDKEAIPLQQQFSFDIQAGNIEPILKILNAPVVVDSGIHITGEFDNLKQYLFIDGFINGLTYLNFNTKNIVIKSNTNEKGFYTNLQMDDFRYDAYDIASTVNFKSNIFNDQGVFSLTTSSENTLGDATISGSAYASNDSVYLHINKSNFFFNHKKWFINEGNDILFAKGDILLQRLILEADKQRIAVNEIAADWNDAAINLSNIELSPVNNMIGFDDMNIQGLVNGQLYVKDLLDSMQITYQLHAPSTTIDEIQFGEIKANGTVDIYKGEWTLGEQSAIKYENAVGGIAGIWNYKEEQVDLDINAEKLPLVWMQPFTKGYVHNISGTSNIRLHIKGNRLDPEVEGKIVINNAGVTPDITGVAYTIPEGEILVDKMHFTFMPFQVLDAYKNSGLLSGAVLHDGLSKLDFSLNFATDQIQALNLNKFQGDYFYGSIFAKANVSLRGLVDDINMNIIGTPLKDSKLYIPIRSESDYSMYNYIQFKKHEDDTFKSTYRPKRVYNYNLRIDAIATKDLEAIIILDEETNDQLQTKGYGNLTLEIPSDGDMRLNGVYVIDEGTYNFAFKQLEIFNYKRQFIIDPQSSIKWNGDLYDADLDISAYTQVKARLYDLILNETDRVALTKSELSDAQLTQLFNVKMNMIGRLSQPNLKFNVTTVENRSIGTYAYQKLQRINADERELLNQVTGLLLLGQFIPPEGFNASASNASISAGAITNMSEVFSTVASSQISNFANKLLGIEDLYIGLRYKNYAMSGIDPLNPTSYTNRNEAGFNVRKNFLNNRLIAEVGGVYDWGVQKTSGSLSDNIAGDFRIQYSLTDDGSVRLKLFRTSSYDAVLQQNIGRHGAGIIYKKSFTTFGDLFKRRKLYHASLPAVGINN